MGHFYANITLEGPTQRPVADYLNRLNRSAYVSPSINQVTVVYDGASGGEDERDLGELAEDLSETFQCRALAVVNYDDAVLRYRLYEAGELIDEYESHGVEDRSAASARSRAGGDSKAICRAFAVEHAVDRVDAVLHRTAYLFQVDRHLELVELLRISSFAVGMGFKDVEHISRNDPELSDRCELNHFIKTGT